MANDNVDELGFLEKILKSHLANLSLEADCEGKLVHDELKDLCRRMKAVQEKEADVLRGWIDEWCGARPNEILSLRYQAMIRELASLSGREYEKLFLEHLTDNLSETLEFMEGRCSEKFHAELFEYCQEAHDQLNSDYELMAVWLCEWYNIC